MEDEKLEMERNGRRWRASDHRFGNVMSLTELGRNGKMGF